MYTYLRNPLTVVWALLTSITILSWWIGRGHGVEFHPDAAITVSVLGMAAIKAAFVIGWFMEVRGAPAWLKRAAYGWVCGLLALLLGAYLVPLTG